MADDGYFAVLDNGSGILKIGYAGFEYPSKIPTIVAERKCVEANQPSFRERKCDYLYFGSEAEKQKSTLALSYPMSRGFVTDWDHMIELWIIAFREIGVTRTNALPTLITEPPKWPMSQRSRTAEIMFEEINVPSLCFESTAVLNLRSEGLTTGVSLDLGNGITSAVAVHQGKEVASSIQRMDFGGRDLAKHIMRTLEGNEKNHWPGYEGSHRTSNRASIRHYVMEAMEKYCYVASDFEAEMRKEPLLHAFNLPDGKEIEMGQEAFFCPEALFQPAFVGLHGGGIHEMTCKAIQSGDEEIQEDLYENIVLCGGVAQMCGLLPRLRKEISALTPEQDSVNITGPLLDSAWKGGSRLAAKTFFPDMLKSKKDYDEAGPNAFL